MRGIRLGLVEQVGAPLVQAVAELDPGRIGALKAAIAFDIDCHKGPVAGVPAVRRLGHLKPPALTECRSSGSTG